VPTSYNVQATVTPGLVYPYYLTLPASASANFSSPPPIGNITPNSGSFTTLTSTGGAFNGSIGSITPSTGVFTSAQIAALGNITPGTINATSYSVNGTLLSSTNLTDSSNLARYNTTGNFTALQNLNAGLTAPTAQIAVLGGTAPGTGSFTVLNGVPQTSSGATISSFTQCSGNPLLSPGSEGSLTSATIRDPTIWYARGKLWALYTFATNNVSPYGTVTLGLASTSDSTGCSGWTKVGQVVTPGGSYATGAIFSPWAYYTGSVASGGTDDLYVYVSVTASATQWYGGPSTLAVFHLGAGVDWTVPSHWTNPTSALLTGGSQAWEGTQGLYAPSMIVTSGGTYNLYYSSSSSTAGTFYAGLATASGPGGPFTKYSGNPVFGDGDSEEPDCSILPTNQIYCLTDDAENYLPTGSFRIFSTSDITGQTGWSEQVPYTMSPTAGWYTGGHLGSQGIVAITPGNFVMVSSGATNASSTAVRSIGFFDYSASYVTSTPSGVVATSAGTGSGIGWGSTFTVSNGTGNTASIGIGENSSRYGSVYWDEANSRLEINTVGNVYPVYFSSPTAFGGTTALTNVHVGNGTTNTMQIDGIFPVTCSLSATQFSTCNPTVNWPATFPDALYSAECTISAANVLSVITGSSSKTTVNMNVQVTNLSSTAGSVTYLDCHAVHN
jgi:hypothetical protein